MSLGGGLYLTHNKILPGAYINFVSKPRSLGSVSDRGVLAMALSLPFCPDDEIFTITREDFTKDSISIFGMSIEDERLMPLREAFMGAKEIKLYKLNADGEKASGTLGGLTVTAKYSGTLCNDVQVSVSKSVDDEMFTVATFLNGQCVDKQSVALVSDLKENSFVKFSGTMLSAANSIPLTGGTDGAVTGSSYQRFLDKVEKEQFQVLVYAGDDLVTKRLFSSFTKRMRDDEGVKLVTVMHDYPEADYEGIISVLNNVDHDNKEALCYWVAGMSAGANCNESLTNRLYDGELMVLADYKTSQYEKSIKEGNFAFYKDGASYRVLTDINTFVSFTPNKNKDFRSNRVVRVLDQIGNDISDIFTRFYLGKVSNNDMGRNIFKSELINYFGLLQGIEAVESFAQEDLIISMGAEKQDVVVAVSIKPVDCMEKLYMNVIVC